MCVNELLENHGRHVCQDKSGLQKLTQIISNTQSSETEQTKSWKLIQHELHKYVIATNTLVPTFSKSSTHLLSKVVWLLPQ